jgi:phosphoribosylformimino-5-aminoimidazole carboxamide ribotide isomerase
MIGFIAIDIRQGQCVRLIQGKAEQQTTYFDSPIEVASMWQQQGAAYLHIVDLDGAFGQASVNQQIITRIAQTVTIPIQVGGGIRSLQQAKAYLDAGVSRVILGTAAIKQPALLDELLSLYGNRIVVSLDCLNGFVQVAGWVEGSAIHALTFARELREKGVETIVYTDITKDGMLMGPNFDEIEDIQASGLQVIASGGVSSIEDVIRLKDMGVYGVIIGKALYEKKISLKQLQEVL